MINSIRIFFLLFCIQATFYSQTKVRFPIWSFHDDSVNIIGISSGFNATNLNHVKVYGINFELLGFGILLPLIPESPIKNDSSYTADKLKEELSMTINGVHISPLGMACDAKVNGLNINGIGTILMQTNGVSISFFANFSEVNNGVQITLGINQVSYLNGLQFAGIFNDAQLKSNGTQIAIYNKASNHKGVQIGIINKTKKLKGLQIGLWNVNSKRKLPLLNWSTGRQ